MGPDPNPVAHVRDIRKRRIESRNPAPNSIVEYKIASQEECCQILQETSKDLVQGMSSRTQIIVETRGGIINFLIINTLLNNLLHYRYCCSF